MVLDKDQLKYITQAITPDQTTYVALVSNILSSIPEDAMQKYEAEENCDIKENPLLDDILFLNKIQAFIIRIKDIEWVISTETLKYKLNDLYFNVQNFLNNIIPLFRLAYQYDDNIFSALTLPECTDVMELLNDLKDTVFEFINKKYTYNCDTAERSSMKRAAEECLTNICRTLYEYRLARCGTEYTKAIAAKEISVSELPVQGARPLGY